MDYKDEIVKKIQGMTCGQSVYSIFEDWVEMLALSISNSIDVMNYREREELYMSIAKKYDKKHLNTMCEMNSLLIEAFEHGMDDVLGYVYMHLEISSSRLGQFFTPYHICQLMARMNKPEPDADGVIRINEPSCGAGGNIIAFAEWLRMNGINYQEVLIVVCQDLDWKAVYMCYVQLSLYGIPAVVVQGNTLSEPYTGGRIPNAFRTPMNILNEYKLRRESNVRKI